MSPSATPALHIVHCNVLLTLASLTFLASYPRLVHSLGSPDLRLNHIQVLVFRLLSRRPNRILMRPDAKRHELPTL